MTEATKRLPDSKPSALPKPEAIAAYRQALKKLAQVVKTHQLDPELIPVEDADAEVKDLCPVFTLLVRRRVELRKVYVPTARLELSSAYAAHAANAADQNLVDEALRSGHQDDDPARWTMRASEDAETFIADAVTDLHQLAEAVGLDWDNILGSADRYYHEDVAGDTRAQS